MPDSPTEKQKPPSKSQATKSRLGSEAEPARNKSLGGNSVPNETKSAKSQDSQINRASRARSSQRTKSNANWDSHDQRISTTGMSQGSNALSQNGNLLRKTDVPPNVYHKPGFQAARYNTIYSVIQRLSQCTNRASSFVKEFSAVLSEINKLGFQDPDGKVKKPRKLSKALILG